MQVQIPPLLSAPLVSGHPQGLPGEQPDPLAHTRVRPIADARDPEARMKEGQSPTKFWSAVNGEPDPATHTAPPSILQITITRMLDEQNPAMKADSAETQPEDPGTQQRNGHARTTGTSDDPAKGDASAPRAGPTTDSQGPPDQSPSEKAARNSVFSTFP